MAESRNVNPQAQAQAQAPVQEQPGQQIRLRMDERNLSTSYCNFFRTSATAEEILLDFGLNLGINPAQEQGGTPDMIVQLNQRVVMNYFSAKRLALTLGQFIRRHEDQFGELELDATKRQKK